MVRLDSAVPRFWKARLLGAKMVMFSAVSMKGAREALANAPPAAVRLNAEQVRVKSTGGMRNVSMVWMMPPLKAMSWDGVESSG